MSTSPGYSQKISARWAELLSHQRLYGNRTQKFEDGDTGRTPFDADYGRLIFSSQFRRLQDKTQVFPLAKSDYTRTRLTHTIEVASVGMGLGKALGGLLQERGELPDHLSPADLGTVVSVACLAHDIGNPPFGHSGEAAIQEWAQQHGGPDGRLRHLKAAERSDIESFEGNAQSFRITARLWGRSRLGGGQLTLASYGALLKYPQGSSHKKDRSDAARKKFNYTDADATLAEEVRSGLGLEKLEEGQFVRHPLVYLMEAADDICYRVVDMEDACDAGLISKREFCELLRPLQPAYRQKLTSAQLEAQEMSELRAHAVGELIRAVLVVLRTHLDDIREGRFPHALIDAVQQQGPELYAAFQQLGETAKSKVYTDERVLQVEFAGFKVIGGLLDEFMNALPPEFAPGDPVRLTRSGEKLYKLFPPTYLELRPELSGVMKGLRPADAVVRLTPYERVLAITDYVSGMTDSYALELYRTLTGVTLP